MEFEESIKKFSERVAKLKEKIKTEEATKTSIIMPFFQMLGYDIFNPNEFIPEYIADVGIKKGEKVDYAIVIEGKVTILVEAKSIDEPLQKHDSQLFRYFGTSDAKLAILTNGTNYKFYSDLEETNKMDKTPFLEIDILDLSDSDIVELKKFSKNLFNINTVINSASDLKYLNSIEKLLKEEFSNPSEEFTRMILNKGVYDGIKTQNIVEKYKVILKKSINKYVNQIISDRLQNVITDVNENKESIELDKKDDIITTKEEIESYYIVKSILSEIVDINRIYYKDTYSYFGILLDNKVTRWICRVYLKENVNFVIIPDEDKQEKKYEIDSVTEIYKLKEELTKRLKSVS